MNKRLLFSLFLLSAAAMAAISCNRNTDDIDDPDKPGDGDDSVSVTVNELTFGNMADSASVVFSADGAWVASADQTWVHISPASGGRGMSNVMISVDENATYDARQAVITVTSTDDDDPKDIAMVSHITVRQRATGTLVLSGRKFVMENVGGSFDVITTSNLEYDIVVPQGMEWIAQSIASLPGGRGVSQHTHTFNVAHYDKRVDGSGLRHGYVLFKQRGTSVGIVDTVYVEQEWEAPGEFFVRQPGTLGQRLSAAQKDTITSLKLFGSINDVDFATLMDMPKLSRLDLGQVTCYKNEIPDNAFCYQMAMNGKELTHIVLPESLQRIGNSAFAYCRALQGVLAIPSGVRVIGANAFSECGNIEGELVLPGGLVEIGAAAFVRCSGLTGALVIPENATTIGHDAFVGCSGFTSLVLPEKLTRIEDYTFELCTGLSGRLVIPSSVTYIGPGAFGGCEAFDAVRLLWMEPIEYQWGMFVDGSMFEVPATAVSKYEAAPSWADHSFIYVPY